MTFGRFEIIKNDKLNIPSFHGLIFISTLSERAAANGDDFSLDNIYDDIIAAALLTLKLQ